MSTVRPLSAPPGQRVRRCPATLACNPHPRPDARHTWQHHPTPVAPEADHRSAVALARTSRPLSFPLRRPERAPSAPGCLGRLLCDPASLVMAEYLPEQASTQPGAHAQSPPARGRAHSSHCSRHQVSTPSFTATPAVAGPASGSGGRARSTRDQAPVDPTSASDEHDSRLAPRRPVALRRNTHDR